MDLSITPVQTGHSSDFASPYFGQMREGHTVRPTNVENERAERFLQQEGRKEQVTKQILHREKLQNVLSEVHKSEVHSRVVQMRQRQEKSRSSCLAPLSLA